MSADKHTTTGRCFCRDTTCDGWQRYVADHREVHDTDPTDDDIELDKALKASSDELLARIIATTDMDAVKADLYARMRERSGGAS